MFAGIPWYSTFTLGTETVITICIFYLFYRAYYEGVFSHIFAGLVLSYEIIFNISYMASRFKPHVNETLVQHSQFRIGLAIFHGTFSLLMFILLVVFLAWAWHKYSSGINYFREHKILTVTFLCAWMVAILSGFVFYYVEYFSDSSASDTGNLALLQHISASEPVI